jgi:hypothetical protein
MKTFGLGDLAYYAFRPLVYFIDWVWQTDLRHCDVCKDRRARWNAVFGVPRWVALIFAVTMCALAIWWRRET